MEAPDLADLINEAEIEQLSGDFGPTQRQWAPIGMDEQTFDFWWRKIVKKRNRRGEVALAIRRPDGRTLLHTKDFYPAGLFRLPTGGIHPNEDVVTAVIRETKEETGLDVELDRFLGMVTYEFSHQDRRIPFVSYVFLLLTDETPPVPEDDQERISGFRYANASEVKRVAAELRMLKGSWAGWGLFRAVPHDVVAQALLQ